MNLFLKTFFSLVFFLFISIFTSGPSLAETTPFRSAQNVTTKGDPTYINISNCSLTDGHTCDRLLATSYADLYFKDFGDFGIPEGSKVTHARIRVTSESNTFNSPLYVGVSQGSTFGQNCQFPSWIWEIWDIGNYMIKTFNFRSPVTTYSLRCLTPVNINNNNLIWRINHSSGAAWYARIDNFEIAFDYIPPLTPTIIPSPTPGPFLELPWDYKSKGSTFNEAALAINSYFDHEYPFLSSGIREPIDSSNSVRKYNGPSRSNDYYSSHDGYDYGSPAKIEDGDWVLAAAPGEATLVKEENSRGGGNVVKITHPNGFQTWYEHLSSNDLIVATEDTKVDVEQGQKIGRVGHSGNCYVENNGTKFYNTLACAHLHFSVFQDKNEDEDFRDNLPDGVTDPFGWQSTDPDPWENYTFNYGGKEKKGNKSYYLWNTNLAGMKTIIATSGGNFKNERFTFNFGPNTISKSLNIEIISEPIVKVSKILQSIGSTIKATAKDSLGNLVTQFDNPYTLSVDFENFDLSNIDLESIAIYSSSEGVVWLKEPTIMDIVNKKVTSQINHFSYFAVMGEKKDLTPPETKVIVDGGGEKNGWYNSEINLSLDANDEGIGVDKIYYKIEGEDWNTYQTPINFSEEGNHKIEFYAEDKGENVEDVKKVEFKIDKTPPVLSSQTSIEGSPYTFNSWTNKDVTTTFSCTDSLSGIDNFSSPITVSSEGENQSVEGECKDNAGNVSRLKISGINIDKTPPDLTLTAPLSIWPPNGKMVNIEIGGAINEPHLLSKKFTIIDEYNKIEPEMTDFSTIQLEAKRNGDDPDGRQYLISLEATDLAGNKNRAEIKVIVPHDKSSK